MSNYLLKNLITQKGLVAYATLKKLQNPYLIELEKLR
jgi:hypothetical protein